MKFTIKPIKICAVFDGKFLKTKNGSIYKLIYYKEGNYYVQKTHGEQEIIMSDLGLEYIKSNLNNDWTLHDTNPSEI